MARLMEFHRQQPRLREGMQIFVKTLTGKTSSLRPGGCIPDLIPTRGTCLRLAQQVYTSHDKSTPRATSLRLARKVSASHDKSPPRATSPAPTSVRGPAAQLGRRHQRARRSESPRHAETTTGGHAGNLPHKSLNAGLTSRATITSPSSPTLPHARLNPRHSSTLYDAHKLRLRLGRGKLGKHSGRLRQAQTTQREGQASQREQSNPSMRRLPRQGIATRLKCIPMDGDVRRDVPAARHCNSFLLPLVPLPL
jgi:hypothetical protein